ncbi:MAG TPA: TMEM143 family protein [Xanthobacteraceae bacterium]
MTDNPSDSGAGQRDRFIPVRKADILDALITHGRLRDGEGDKFRQFGRLLGAIYHYEYFERLEALRNDYYYFNPDLPPDTAVDPARLAHAHDELVTTLVGVLETADFVEITPQDIARSHQERPVLKVEVKIPTEDYRDIRFFRRGHHRITVEVRDRLGLRKRNVEVDTYDHLVLMVMVKPAAEIKSKRLARQLAKSRLRPGTILIKYFRDVARGDLNMLFPNVRVVMSLFDTLMLGLPALGGGIPILLNVLPTLSVLFLVAGAYLGVSGTVHDDDMKKALAALSAIAALGGFLMRQWLKYQRQSLKYHKQITDNVYFRNVNNNAGVLDAIVGSAEEQECKEAFMAYYFLATASAPLSQGELERHIEQWLKDTFRIDVNFEVAEALAKLERLALLRRDGEKVAVPPLDTARELLDRRWAGFFPAAKAAE